MLVAGAGDGSIELDRVTFGYDDRTVLRDVSLRVPPRSMTALVGPADRIVVLDDGRVTEAGTHDEPLAAGGPYSAFWNRTLPCRRLSPPSRRRERRMFPDC